MTAAQR